MANDDDIDYTPEGATPPNEKDDPTNAGYDEAAHRGPGAYGVREGDGGVFGTTGGGSYPEGMHIEERPVIEGTERGRDEVTKPASSPAGSSDRGSSRGR
jgi:hypothetical protein